MRALGFNVIRLCVNWNLLEPSAGTYDDMYVERIAQIVGWAKEQDIYVLLDMHMDVYSRFIVSNPNVTWPPYLLPSDGGDGAAPWATQTDGLPPVAVLGIQDLNLAAMRAYDHFYNNDNANGAQGAAPGPGLQDHWIGAMAVLARRFLNESTVLGFEIMNEPLPGSHLDLVDFADNFLFQFYKRTIQALTGVRDGLPDCPATAPGSSGCAYPDLGIHSRQLMFFEPTAVRNQLDFSLQTSKAFSTYENLVFAPHCYTHVFTLDRVFNLPENTTLYPPSFDFAYQTAAKEATGLNAAVFVTEFGAGVGHDEYILRNHVAAQERAGVGGTVWSWKSNCEGGAACDVWCVYRSADGPDGFVPIPQNGVLVPSREKFLSRVYPRYFWGTLAGFGFNPDTLGFSLNATATAASPAGVFTEVYIPRHVNLPVTVSGSAALNRVESYPDGSRAAFVQVLAAGPYSVQVGQGFAFEPAPTLGQQEQELVQQLVGAAMQDYRKAVVAVAQLGERLVHAATEIERESLQWLLKTAGNAIHVAESAVSELLHHLFK